MRTAIWDKVQSFDLSQYMHTPFIRPLELFVKFMLEEGRTSEHTPEDVGRWVSSAPHPVCTKAFCMAAYAWLSDDQNLCGSLCQRSSVSPIETAEWQLPNAYLVTDEPMLHASLAMSDSVWHFPDRPPSVMMDT